MKQGSQVKDVLQYMKDNGKITSLDAIREFNATRLSGIIYILRHQKGHDIVTIQKQRTNIYGHKVNYAEYHLKG